MSLTTCHGYRHNSGLGILLSLLSALGGYWGYTVSSRRLNSSLGDLRLGFHCLLRLRSTMFSTVLKGSELGLLVAILGKAVSSIY